MISGIPKISVYIITYNQENVIERTLASVLSQIDYVYEICVSDDCSTDRTWDILQDYSRQYPGLFKLNQNNPNLGIFENTEKVWTMPSGDIVHDLAGDDCVGEGWFKKVVEFIKEKDLDYKNEMFCIYGDYKAVYPNGDSFIHSNKAVTTGVNPLKLCLRGIICNRSACYSINVLRKFVNVSQGRSFIAEGAQDRQLQVWAEKNYYVSGIGNIYYTRIGVSTTISGNRKKEHYARWDYLLSNLKQWNVDLDNKDINYINYRKAKENQDTWRQLLFGIKNIDYRLGIKGLRLRRLLFAILRRLPHKRAISNFRV